MALPELEAIRNTAPMLIEDGLFDGQLLHTQVQGDGTRLPFPDNTFDKIIASEVLEHIPDDVAAYDEFFRILKPGGSIAATVPATFPEKICWKLSDEYYAPKAEGGHVRIYTENEVRSKLEAPVRPGPVVQGPRPALAVLVDPVRRRREQRGRRQLDREAVPQAAEWDIVSQPWITRQPRNSSTRCWARVSSSRPQVTLRTEKLSQIREAADAGT